MLNTGNKHWRKPRGFTLLELLITIAIISILGALLFPVLAQARRNASRVTCLNNTRQISLATRMYGDDHQDAVILDDGFGYYGDWSSYKDSVKSYLSLRGPDSPSERLFACPADTFRYLDSDLSGGPPWKGFRLAKGLCEDKWTGFSSYAFNGGNRLDPRQYPNLANPGIANTPLTFVKHPSRTLLIFEAAARLPFSWHQPEVDGRGFYRFDDSRDMLGFVDGHVDFMKMYWNGAQAACMYDPPPGYRYQWSPN